MRLNAYFPSSSRRTKWRQTVLVETRLRVPLKKAPRSRARSPERWPAVANPDPVAGFEIGEGVDLDIAALQDVVPVRQVGETGGQRKLADPADVRPGPVAPLALEAADAGARHEADFG